MTVVPSTRHFFAASEVTSQDKPSLTPADFAERTFLNVNDMDGTALSSYEALRMVEAARHDIPEIFQDLAVGWYGKKSPQFEMVSKYFENCSDCGDHNLCKVDQLLREVGHSRVLHQPLEALNDIVERITTDFKDMGIIHDGPMESDVYDEADKLKSEYTLYQSLGHTVFEQFYDWVDRCYEYNVANPIYTNTGVTHTVLKLMAIHGKEPGELDLDKVGMVMARQDASVTRGGVKWDGSEDDFQNLVSWMKVDGHLDPEDPRYPEKGAKLREVHKFIHVFEGTKPSPEPLKRIIELHREKIEKSVNDELSRSGWAGEPFRMTAKNVSMTGESVSDFGCTFDHEPAKGENTNTPAYFDALVNSGVPRVAQFNWQRQGASIPENVRNADYAIRGAVHLHPIHAFGLEDRADRVMGMGYKTLNSMADRGSLVLGLNVRHVAEPDRSKVAAVQHPDRHTDPLAWKQSILAHLWASKLSR